MKKILMLLLSLGTCFALAACADSVESTQSSDNGSTATATESSDEGIQDSSEPETEYVTVTFKQDGQADVVKTLEKGDSLTDIPVPVQKTGYTVVWDKTEFEGITENVVVTAQETANTYTVTYDADGFEIDGTTVELTYDSPCTALDMTLTRADATFLGWKYGEVTYTQVSVWNIAENVTVTTDWALLGEVVVSFTDTDGTTINKTVYEGETLTDIPTPSAKTGYVVDTENWYADEACTIVATFADLQENKTVYAKATAKTYTITLNANGGTLTETTVTVTYGQAYTLAVPVHDDYPFGGWLLDGTAIALSGVWKIDVEGTELTLTADWEKGSWTGYY